MTFSVGWIFLVGVNVALGGRILSVKPEISDAGQYRTGSVGLKGVSGLHRNQVGPCDTDHALISRPGNRFGACNCQCFEDLKLDYTKMQICRKNDYITKEIVEYMYHPGWRWCFRLREQGPCGRDEILKETRIMNNVTVIHCEEASRVRVLEVGGHSEELEMRQSNDSEEEFIEYDLPNCVEKDLDDYYGEDYEYYSPGNVVQIRCSPGMTYSKVLKKCLKLRRRPANAIGK